jgi:vacuolar-type H+-ATPase catalytic subunit A/Vma1
MSIIFPILANRLTTNEDMTRTGTINNTLNMRGLDGFDNN